MYLINQLLGVFDVVDARRICMFCIRIIMFFIRITSETSFAHWGWRTMALPCEFRETDRPKPCCDQPGPHIRPVRLGFSDFKPFGRRVVSHVDA